NENGQSGTKSPSKSIKKLPGPPLATSNPAYSSCFKGKNNKILSILMMTGYVEHDRIQIQNNLWSFFIMCTFGDSKIMIEKAGRNERYLYKGETEQNPEICDEFIEYVLSKLT
ncbi:MAG: hypothetical protein ACTSRI_15640, partial [Promethearchaeota archaeon]